MTTAQRDALPMPPRRRRKEIRVQLNTRIPQSLSEQLTAFVEQNEAAVQDVIETAITEYLDRRS